MIRQFLSRYQFSYPRTLVYMLQASEYNVRDYLEWFGRTKDFRSVANRGKLVMTAKARLLYGVAVILDVLMLLVIAWSIIMAAAIPTYWLVAAGLVIFKPSLLAYLLILPLLVGRVLIQRPKERRIISQARRKLAGHSAVKIVIAGSFGKTTFKETLAAVLAEGKKVAATPGNYNTPLGIARFVEGLKGDEEVLIIEAGEYYPGDILRVCDMVVPGMGVITGVNQQHQMRFKTIERAVATIFELADYLVGKQLWVNGESELAAVQGRGRMYSRNGVGEWKVEDAKTGLDGTAFTAKRDKMVITAKSQLMGLHQVGPLVAVIDIAAELGLTPKQIGAGITKTAPFKHRMNPSEANGVITIDDTYNGNPDGFKAAIEFLSGLKGHRRVYVTPGIVELGDQTADVHRAIGRQLAGSGIEIVMLIKNSATPYIEEGLKEGKYPGQLMWQPDIMSALTALPQLTVKGDVVYLQNDWNDNYA